MIRRLVPVLRRLTQFIALAVLVLLPLLALYTHFKEAHSLHDLTADTWQHAAIREIDRAVGDNPARRSWVAQTQGTIWSARLFGVSLSDPLAGAEAILSSRSFYRPMLWSLLIPVTVTVLLGRVFCGWICPMNTLLELVDAFRRLLRFAEIRERDVKFSLKNKYLVLAVVLGLVAITSVPFVALFYPPALMSREMHLAVFGSTIGIGTYLIVAVCAIELFVSKRWWCRSICPGGALYSLLGRFRVIRVVRNEHNCVQCGECVRVCQFDLRPMLVQMTGMECTNCGSCVRACHDDALRFAFVLPGITRNNESPTKTPHSTSGRTPSQVVPLSIGAPSAPSSNATSVATDGPSTQFSGTPSRSSLLVFLSSALLGAVAGLSPSAALAHHILGLPHYSYKENYPQAPTLEYPATTGPFDVLMTSFPGHPVPQDRTTIAFYIKDRNSGEPYALPVTMRVLRTATFGANQVIMEPTVHEPATNQHKYFVNFPQDGEYIAELTMDVEGRPEIIPFLIVAGQPSAAKSILIATSAGLGLFLLVVRAIRIKQKRRSANLPATSTPNPAHRPAAARV
ncbi:MAG: 4Fe-4S binding protein [Planctomycetales bacterium]